jgi:hypothetical protein
MIFFILVLQNYKKNKKNIILNFLIKNYFFKKLSQHQTHF